MIHGGRRMQLSGGSPLDEARRVAIRDHVLEDIGGAAECSQVLYELVSDFAAACVLRDLCWRHIAAVGPMTSKGRRRAAVSLYLEASARAERLAARIGVDRKAAPVPTLAQYLESRTADGDGDGKEADDA